MKKDSPESKFPLITDEDHIYNKLIDGNMGQVDLGWAVYDIELHHDLYHDNDKVDGLTEFHSRKIKLEMSLDHVDARETVLHEILHCIFESTGMDEKNFDGVRFFTSNENLVVTTTKQLLTFNKLNPGLLGLLLDDE